nr:hypothetical protein [Actinomycetota bacterium]
MATDTEEKEKDTKAEDEESEGQETEGSTENDDGDSHVGTIEEITGVVIEAAFTGKLPDINNAIVVEFTKGGSKASKRQSENGDGSSEDESSEEDGSDSKSSSKDESSKSDGSKGKS